MSLHIYMTSEHMCFGAQFEICRGGVQWHAFGRAEGVVQLLESGEARRKAASGNELQRQQAAAERAHKAVKASRDKKLGRKAAEDALQEDTSGERACSWCVWGRHAAGLTLHDQRVTTRQAMVRESSPIYMCILHI